MLSRQYCVFYVCFVECFFFFFLCFAFILFYSMEIFTSHIFMSFVSDYKRLIYGLLHNISIYNCTEGKYLTKLTKKCYLNGWKKTPQTSVNVLLLKFKKNSPISK